MILRLPFVRTYDIAHDTTRTSTDIEDVVVDSRIRGRGLGKKIVSKVREAAKKLGCYKCILDCSESNVRFYEKCGFRENEHCMALYFHEKN